MTNPDRYISGRNDRRGGAGLIWLGPDDRERLSQREINTWNRNGPAVEFLMPM
jgi:hypothetical protein